MSHSPAGNQTDVASVCRLVLSLLNMPQLSRISLRRPSACVAHAAWQGEGNLRGCRCRPATLWPGAGGRCSSFCGYAVFARAVVMCRSRDVCCATLTTFAGAPRHVVCARRRICSSRPRSLQRACARFAAPCAAGGHAVAALACTRGAAGQAIPSAAVAVLRQPPVHPADPPRRCCRPQRALRRRAQIYRLHRQALLQRRRAQALAREAMCPRGSDCQTIKGGRR